MPTTVTEAGYRGIAQLDGITLLATLGKINTGGKQIFTTGTWGANYTNAASKVAYANNYLSLNGELNCEVTTAAFSAINNFAYTNRDTGTDLLLLPDGVSGFTGLAWCTSLKFSCSEGGVVSAQMKWESYHEYATNTIGPVGAPPTGAPPTSNSLYPYWGTRVIIGGTRVADVISWNTTYTAPVSFLKTCGGAGPYPNTSVTPNAPLCPDYLILGILDASGGYSVFTTAGVFSPHDYHGHDDLEIRIQSAGGGIVNDIIFDKINYSTCATSIQLPTAQAPTGKYISADVTFNAIGDGTHPPMRLN